MGRCAYPLPNDAALKAVSVLQLRSNSTLNTQKSLEFAVPLTTGKHGKTKSPRNMQPDGDLRKDLRVSAYGISQSVEVERISLRSFGILGYHRVRLPTEVAGEILVFSKPNENDPKTHHDVLIFRSGVVVFWNILDKECRELLNNVHQHCYAPVTWGHFEWEELRFSLTQDETHLDGEDIILQMPAAGATEEANPPIDSISRLYLEKIAFSDALALSVKLSLLESSFDSVAVQMQPWLEKMKTGLGIFFPQSLVFRKTGELFTLRHLLHVSSNITETPDFYWDRPKVEKLFLQLKHILSIKSRAKILNTKLNTCCELAEILTNHLQARHSSRLEWMIIVLILVEVIFEFHRLYQRWQV